MITIRALAVIVGFALLSPALAEETKPLLNEHALPVLATPNFKEPLTAPWSVAKGIWTPKDGVLEVADIPA